VSITYTHKEAGVKQLLKKSKAVGPILLLTLAGVSAGAAVAMDHLVMRPVKAKELMCESCSMTRGAGVTAGFTSLGMLAITTIYSYHFVPEPSATKTLIHSFNVLRGGAFAYTIIFISGLVGLAVAKKVYMKELVNTS